MVGRHNEKKLILVLGFGLILLSILADSKQISAQTLSAVPVDLEIPLAPTPVKADGKIHLFYELHITNFRAKNPLGSDGVPYVFESFEMQGMLSSKKLLAEGGWRPQSGRPTDKRRLEMPVENAVVRFH